MTCWSMYVQWSLRFIHFGRYHLLLLLQRWVCAQRLLGSGFVILILLPFLDTDLSHAMAGCTFQGLHGNFPDNSRRHTKTSPFQLSTSFDAQSHYILIEYLICSMVRNRVSSDIFGAFFFKHFLLFVQFTIYIHGVRRGGLRLPVWCSYLACCRLLVAG